MWCSFRGRGRDKGGLGGYRLRVAYQGIRDSEN